MTTNIKYVLEFFLYSATNYVLTFISNLQAKFAPLCVRGAFDVTVFPDLSESVEGEDVLYSQDAAQVFLYGRLAVCRLVVLCARSQPGQHLPVLWTLDVLWEERCSAVCGGDSPHKDYFGHEDRLPEHYPASFTATYHRQSLQTKC